MPTIISSRYTPHPVHLGEICYLDVTLSGLLPGPLSLMLELDPRLAYAFSIAGKHLTRVSRRRSISVGVEEYSTRIAFRIERVAETRSDPMLTIAASGLDGTSPPYRLALKIDER